jgi:methylmalonyl-CoA/ethylmalonyl-CoA epimerase
MAIEANNGQTDSGTAKDRLLRDPVPGKARSPLGAIAGGFFQVAFCTTNLDSFLQTLSDDLGVDRFFIIRDAQVTDQTFRGQPCDARQDLAFGYAGSLQFEIIQPLSGESSYSEFLAAHPEGGVHHTGVLVDDYDEAVAELSKKNAKVQTGRVGDTRFAYFDKIGTLGEYIEVLQLGNDFVELFERIRIQDF